MAEEDLMNLKKYNIYVKQLIDGMPSPIFSAGTFPPYAKNDEIFASRYEKILRVSREKYGKNKESVVKKINTMIEDIERQEELLEKRKEDFKKKKEEEKRKAHEERMAAQQKK